MKDYSQSKRLEVLNRFQRAQFRPELTTNGFCNGDSLIWSLHMFENRIDELNEIFEIITQPYFDFYELYLQYKDLLKKNDLSEEQFEVKRKYFLIKQYFDNVIFSQTFKETLENSRDEINDIIVSDEDLISINNSNWHRIINFLRNTHENDLDAFNIEYSMSYITPGYNIIEILQKSMPNFKMVLLNGLEHATALYRENDNIFFYDPNQKSMIKVRNLSEVKFEILRALLNAGDFNLNKYSSEELLKLNVTFTIKVFDKNKNILKRSFNFPDRNWSYGFTINTNGLNTPMMEVGKVLYNIDLNDNGRPLEFLKYANKYNCPFKIENFLYVLLKKNHYREFNYFLENNIITENDINELLINYLIKFNNYKAFNEIVNKFKEKIHLDRIFSSLIFSGTKEFNRFFKILCENSYGIKLTSFNEEEYLTKYLNENFYINYVKDGHKNILHYLADKNIHLFESCLRISPELINYHDELKLTPVDYIIKCGNFNLFKYLIDKKYLNFENLNIKNTVECLIESCSIDFLDYFIQANWTSHFLNYEDVEKNNILHLSAKFKNPYPFKLIDISSEKLNHKNIELKTPFDLSLESKSISLIKYLVEKDYYQLNNMNLYLEKALKIDMIFALDLIEFEFFHYRYYPINELEVINKFLRYLLRLNKFEIIQKVKVKNFKVIEVLHFIREDRENKELLDLVVKYSKFEKEEDISTLECIDYSLNNKNEIYFDAILNNGLLSIKLYREMIFFKCLTNPKLDDFLKKVLNTSEIKSGLFNYCYDIHFVLIACQQNNVNALKVLQSEGYSFDFSNKEGITPFIQAIINNNSEVIEYFMNNHIDLVNFDPIFNSSLIHFAALSGNLKLFHYAMARGLDLNAQVEKNFLTLNQGDTPLLIALNNGHEGIANQLLSNGADFNIINGEGYSALHLSALKNFPKITKTLIENKLDINATNVNGESPIFLSLLNNSNACFDILINQPNIDLSLKSISNDSLLHKVNTNEQCMKIIKKFQLPLDESNDQGMTPLMCALQKSNFELANYLTSKGSSLDTFTINNESILYIAISSRCNDYIFKYFDDLKKYISYENNSGFKPLDIAVMSGNEPIIKLLLDSGAKLNQNYSDDMSSLKFLVTMNMYNSVALKNVLEKYIQYISADDLRSVMSAIPHTFVDSINVLNSLINIKDDELRLTPTTFLPSNSKSEPESDEFKEVKSSEKRRFNTKK